LDGENDVARQTILIVDDDRTTRTVVGSSLQRQGYEVRLAGDGQEALRAVADGPPDLIITDVHMPDMDGLELTQRLRRDPRTAQLPIIMLSERTSSEEVLAGYTEGADDYVPKPVDLAVLTAKVSRLLVRAQVATGSRGATPPPAQFHHGQVIVLLGPKGGVGRSMLACNLAVGLARLYGKHVALLDAHLWHGDLAVLLDLSGERSIASLVDQGDSLDLEALRGVLLHHPSGVEVLLAPPSPELVEAIPVSLPARVARLCQPVFDFVVVDTPSSLEEYVLQLLESADRVVLVTTPEVTALRHTVSLLKLAPTLGWIDRVLLVLNRANTGIAREQVERTLGRAVDLTIPSAGLLLLDAANRGQPILEQDGTGAEQVTRALGRLVAHVAGEKEPAWTGRAAPKWSLPWRATATRPAS
jgi:pilus assembly protein CpaE